MSANGNPSGGTSLVTGERCYRDFDGNALVGFGGRVNTDSL